MKSNFIWLLDSYAASHIESSQDLYTGSLETGGYHYRHVPIWQSERLFLWIKKNILLDMLMTLTNKNCFLSSVILEDIHTPLYMYIVGFFCIYSSTHHH